MARRRLQRAGALRDLSPRKILTQIAILQTAYYVVAFVLITFTTLVAGKDWSIGLFLDWRSLRGDTTEGWTLGLCWMLSSLVGVILLLVFINRSKLIPDFSLTLHFINLLLNTLYTGILPRYRFWWLLQISSAALMTFLGIWACQRRELAPISFGGGANIERPKDTPGLPPEGQSRTASAARNLLGWVNNLRGTPADEAKDEHEMAPLRGEA